MRGFVMSCRLLDVRRSNWSREQVGRQQPADLAGEVARGCGNKREASLGTKPLRRAGYGGRG